ncbi:MAG TPA: flagellar hook capping protein [Candidatus Paenibacillus intestinavium]|nr:flagellar hook capping protein [Candidatus Paenibacillus intestinavium]
MTSSVTSVWPNYDKSNVSKAAAKSNELGKDQFLSILVAQLRNQDPMNPMSDTDFIAQMAQFTSVEQLSNMAGELALIRQNIGSASSLIGKTVTWNEFDETGKVIQRSGVVDSIISQDGLLYVEVGGARVGIDFVGQISETKLDAVEPDESTEETPEVAEGGSNETSVDDSSNGEVTP